MKEIYADIFTLVKENKNGDLIKHTSWPINQKNFINFTPKY